MPLPTIIPMLTYEDGPAAIEWLCRVFGFAVTMRMLDDAGRVAHAELRLGDGVIFLASTNPDYQSPRHHAELCPAAREWRQSPWVIDGQMVHVSDIVAHFDRAKAAGAIMLSAIEEGYPDRRFRVEDCEGHRWMFLERTSPA